MKHYVIPGNPTPMQRPRLNAFSGTVYNPQSKLMKNHKEFLQRQIPAKYKPFQDDRLSLNVTFFMPIPASLSAKKQKELLNQYHTKRPDLDNMTKWVCDVANTILYTDDSIIVNINATKVYSEEPRTVFYLWSIPSIHLLYEADTITFEPLRLYPKR